MFCELFNDVEKICFLSSIEFNCECECDKGSISSQSGSLCSSSLGCKTALEMLHTLSIPIQRNCPWCDCKKSQSINMDSIAYGFAGLSVEISKLDR